MVNSRRPSRSMRSPAVTLTISVVPSALISVAMKNCVPLMIGNFAPSPGVSEIVVATLVMLAARRETALLENRTSQVMLKVPHAKLEFSFLNPALVGGRGHCDLVGGAIDAA